MAISLQLWELRHFVEIRQQLTKRFLRSRQVAEWIATGSALSILQS